MQLIEMVQQANHDLNRKLYQLSALRDELAQMQMIREDMEKRLVAAMAARKRWFSFR